MKNLFMALAVMAFVLTSCGSKQQSTEETHTHVDGSVHEGHDHSDHEHAVGQQETFEVTPDSAATSAACSDNKESCDHSCNGCEHTN